jgi:hypothetical protein
MFTLTKKTPRTANGVISLKHSKMQKTLLEKNKRKKIRYVKIALNNFHIYKILRTKLNEEPTIEFNQPYEQTCSQKRIKRFKTAKIQ